VPSFLGAEFSWCRVFLVPNFLGAEFIGAESSSAEFPSAQSSGAEFSSAEFSAHHLRSYAGSGVHRCDRATGGSALLKCSKLTLTPEDF